MYKEYTVKVFDNGDVHWLNINNQLHRVYGPAIEYAYGDKKWYVNGKLHREDGPAVEFASGSKFWYINGKLHREDGPAIEYADGGKSWWVNGKKLSEEEFNNRLGKSTCDGKVVEIEGKKYELKLMEMSKKKYTLSQAVNEEEFQLLVCSHPHKHKDRLGGTFSHAFAQLLTGNRIACIGNEWDYAYAVSHEIAEARHGHDHTEKVWCEQAMVLSRWIKFMG